MDKVFLLLFVHKKKALLIAALVRAAGLEPALPGGKQILSLLRLPFRHAHQLALSYGATAWRKAVAKVATSVSSL